MKQVQYVGVRPKGLTVHFPYPHTCKSEKRGEATFAGPGDIRDIENADAVELVQNGGGQFVYVEEAKAEKPAVSAPAASGPQTPKASPAPKAKKKASAAKKPKPAAPKTEPVSA